MEVEKEFGLTVISIRSEENSPYFDSIPDWEAAVDLMERYGWISRRHDFEYVPLFENPRAYNC
jgi:hypothetical protein